MPFFRPDRCHGARGIRFETFAPPPLTPGSYNEVPKLPAREPRSDKVLRGVRHAPGARVRQLRHRAFPDRQVLLGVRSFGWSGNSIDIFVVVLALRDPRFLTDQQCVEVWRYYARKRPGWASPPTPPAGEREVLRLWRELTA
jgi:hypothetical protein